MSAAVAGILKGEGIDIRTGVHGLRIARRGAGIAVSLDSERRR